MVVLDAFFLSHTYEPVDVPDQKEVDRFLPPLSPRIKLDTANPYAVNQMAAPGFYMEMRHNIQFAMDRVLDRFDQMEAEFATIFGRKHGALEAMRCRDAEIILITAGTTASTCRHVINDLRAKGEKVGLLKLKMFRPFPTKLIRRHLAKAQKVAVIDRNFSFGASGIFAQEIKSALCNASRHPLVFGYVAGLGGRDVTPETIEEIYRQTKKYKIPKSESIWIGLNQELVESWSN
jgi:pyruvate/2-oxoacid:ferredoxin oxidoreductase alpha subunit